MSSRDGDRSVDHAVRSLRRAKAGQPTDEDLKRRPAQFPGSRPRLLPGQLDLEGRVYDGPPGAA
jgi:hypothetical protein